MDAKDNVVGQTCNWLYYQQFQSQSPSQYLNSESTSSTSLNTDPYSNFSKLASSPKTDTQIRIYKYKQFCDFVTDNACCKKCKSYLVVSEKMHGIASSLTFHCTNKKCNFLGEAGKAMEPLVDELPKKKTKTGKERQYRSVDYCINKLAMVATFFCGTGDDEIGELLSFLDLPFSNGF